MSNLKRERNDERGRMMNDKRYTPNNELLKRTEFI